MPYSQRKLKHPLLEVFGFPVDNFPKRQLSIEKIVFALIIIKFQIALKTRQIAL